MNDRNKQGGGLRPSFSPLGIWAFSIGTSIGWGSFIVTCNTYLEKAGLLGTACGLVLGLAVILVITWNLQHMIRVSPDAGGIYSFEAKMSGKDLGFLAFWFVLLTYLAILWANMTSLPLFARFFLGKLFQFGFTYTIFGYQVWLGEALLSIVAIVLIGLLCAKSAKVTNKVMGIAALVFAGGFALCAVLAVLLHDRSFSYAPFFNQDASALSQIVHITVISPWAFIGFENIAHFSQEYDFPVKRVRRILLSSAILTTLLYLFVCVLSVSAYPPEYASWLDYIKDMGNLEGLKAVPAFYAAEYYLGAPGVVALMLALFGVILTSLIGNLMALSRLLYAAGRDGEAPASVAELSPAGSPVRAVRFVVAVSLLIPFLGRTAIGWIVDVTTLGASLLYGFISHGVFRHAQQEHRRLEQATGMAGMVLMSIFVLLLLVPGLLPFHAMANESYVLFTVWSLLGLRYYQRLLRRDPRGDHGHRVVVWMSLLLLVLFASMMWASRQTEVAAERAVESIFTYHEAHASLDTETVTAAERTAFLTQQANQITRTNILYTVVSLGLFVLSTGIMLLNYRENLKLGQQLSAAEEEAEAARKIAELKESLTALLDNMPLLSFSKDAKTGVYLACNQSYAEFAHRPNPEALTGLTDFEIFPAKTAAHFVADDKQALSMDKPLVFFESVQDAQGNPRQFQTTKFPFYDASGRLCLLGMSMDVTEVERIKREREQVEAAYRQALTTSNIYESIVDALSEDYFDLYYVDLDSNDYIEYGSRTGGEHRMVEYHGKDFFEDTKRNAQTMIFEEDLPRFLVTIDKSNMVQEIQRHGAYIYHYRLLIDGRPTYVSMKTTRIPGDASHIIIGVNNVDSQYKDHLAAERAKEERKTYLRLSALNGNLIVLYVVDAETDHYTEFNATQSFRGLGISRKGDSFFKSTYENSLHTVHPEDLALFRSVITREHVLQAVERDGVFVLDYRLLHDDLPTYVRFKAAQVEEDGRKLLIVGLLNVDAQVRQEQAYVNDLQAAWMMATRDALTGVKNKRAYVEAERELNDSLKDGQRQFAVVVCDINDLKIINDTQGHQAGDVAIRDASMMICHTFKHSPVFRIGGDEFAVICQGFDYDRLDSLMAELEEANSRNRATGGVQVAFGAARCQAEQSVGQVFEQADRRMYAYKQRLKGRARE